MDNLTFIENATIHGWEYSTVCVQLMLLRRSDSGRKQQLLVASEPRNMSSLTNPVAFSFSTAFTYCRLSPR